MRRALTALAALVLSTAAVLGAVPAAAQAPVPGAVADLIVEALPTAVDPAEPDVALRLRIINRTGEVLDGTQVRAVLHDRTRSRFAYQQAIERDEVGAALGSVTVDVPTLPANAIQVMRLRENRAAFGLPVGVEAGVYPLQLRLTVDGDTVEEITTSLVVTAEEMGPRLRTAFLLPLDAPPTVVAPGGVPALSGPTGAEPPPDGAEPLSVDVERVLAAVGPDGRLQELVAAAQAPGAFPVTVASSPRLLDELAGPVAEGADAAVPPAPTGGAPAEATDPALAAVAQDFLTDLSDLVQRPAIGHIALPYGPADLVAMVRGGLALEAVRAMAAAEEIAAQRLGDEPLDGVVWPPDGLDDATLAEAVLPAGGETIVLGEDELAIAEGRELPRSPSPVRTLRTPSGNAVRALVPDPWLTPVLERVVPQDTAVAVQRIVAETAALYFERPFSEDVRGLLLAPPQLWDPPAGLATALLSSLGAAPWLAPVGVDGLTEGVEPELRPVRLDYPDEAAERELPRSLITQIEQAREAVGTLATLLPPGDPTPSRLDRRLLTAPSVHYRPITRRSQPYALVESVQRLAQPLFGAVTVNDGLQLILPGTRGTIPVSVTNDAALPLQVVVTLGAAAQRNLDFAGAPAEAVVLEPSSTTTLPFEAQVRTPGATFPIEVLVTDIGGGRVLARGQLVVRSTAASPVALVVTGGALLFLLLWWLRGVGRRRAGQQQPLPEPVREPVVQ